MSEMRVPVVSAVSKKRTATSGAPHKPDPYVEKLLQLTQVS
jgi:hypothetical protein